MCRGYHSIGGPEKAHAPGRQGEGSIHFEVSTHLDIDGTDLMNI